VASNRLPFTIRRGPKGLESHQSAGGLVSAIDPVLRARGGTWVGWPGIELREDESLPADESSYRIAPVRLTEREITHYLNGFSNRTLWPLFHSLTNQARFDRRSFEIYQRANERFAEAIEAEVERDELIWVHDYHLMTAPGFVREARPAARLAYFLHIPFPPYDVFRLLPWDKELLRGLLACDVIGFHVPGYARNFLDCVENRLGARVDRRNRVVEYGDRAVQVGAFPIGIEFDHFESLALAAPDTDGHSEKIVLGVDRLDYTKGIPERILAFERFLELFPEWRERVMLLQIAVPSRSQVAEYRELKRELDELVGQVNGRFASSHWSPIRYLYRSLDPEELTAVYRDADVALVTPLRDGMNLVAKEYVAAQVRDPGVLILSSLAGAAETMREALIVNPYDLEQTACAIHDALSFDESSRRLRMDALRAREKRDDVHAWVRAFLESAETSHASLTPVSASDFEDWLSPYLTRPRLALFLDYDGTLTELCEHPDEAMLTPEMRAVLADCSGREDTEVAIVSGRALADVAAMVDEPELTYAGNHGLEIRGPGIEDFRHEDLPHYQRRTTELAERLLPLEIEGAWTEAKGPTLTYHFRRVPEARQRGLAEQAATIISAAGFHARSAHKAVEARPPIGWDKGRAVLYILRTRYGPSWSAGVRVVYVGDDDTDEDAFRFLGGLAMTFRVGPSATVTSATHRLRDVDAVQTLLRFLGSRQPSAR